MDDSEGARERWGVIVLKWRGSQRKRGLSLETRMSGEWNCYLSRYVITFFFNNIFFFLVTNMLKFLLQNLRQCHDRQKFYVLFVPVFYVSQGRGRKQKTHSN